MAALALSPQVFAILSGMIEERTGIHYALSDRDLLRDKLEVRVRDVGFGSFLDYYYFLRYDPEGAPEFGRLIDALVVPETYFFREYDQLRVLVSQLLPERIARAGRARVWSAACSTGEEPLTLAMMLRAQGIANQVELVASDLSTRALERARAGKYGKRSARAIPDAKLFERYVARREGDSYTIEPSLIDSITWRQVNLVDRAQVEALGEFDVILCRNVLIYFRDEFARRVLSHLTSALRPQGMLLVSVSESLMRFGTSLHLEERDRVFLYRKAAE